MMACVLLKTLLNQNYPYFSFSSYFYWPRIRAPLLLLFAVVFLLLATAIVFLSSTVSLRPRLNRSKHGQIYVLTNLILLPSTKSHCAIQEYQE